MLDGAVPDMELGAILLSMRIKGESDDELLGFKRALDAAHAPVRLPGGAAPGGDSRLQRRAPPAQPDALAGAAPA